MLLRKTGLIPMGFDPIGVIIPGIIARSMDRQGIIKTLLSLVITTAATALVIECCRALGI